MMRFYCCYSTYSRKKLQTPKHVDVSFNTEKDVFKAVQQILSRPQPYPQASPLWCKQDHKGLGAFSGAGAHFAECRTGWKPEHQHASTKEQPLALSNRGWHIDTPAPWLLEGTEMKGWLILH